MSGPVRAFHTWISLHVLLDRATSQGGKAGRQRILAHAARASPRKRSVSSRASAVILILLWTEQLCKRDVCRRVQLNELQHIG